MSREIILLAVSRKYKIYHILDPLATPKFSKSILDLSYKEKHWH